eukprot:m.381975 g.381975  ORF g.381975 m.381975 type:complete len:326 (-) comp20045_c7_seq11:1080-2057(-)
MLSALLTGVNRAYPFAKLEDGLFQKHVDTLFKVVHVGSFSCSVQALMLLLQVMDTHQTLSDRLFRAIYAKLMDPQLFSSSKQAMFLNIVFRAMKGDPSLDRVKAFFKRVLQICLVQQAPFICGSLFLLSEVVKVKPALKSLVNQLPASDSDDEQFFDAPDSDDEHENASDDGEESNDEDNKESNKDGSDAKNPVLASAPNAKRSHGYDPRHREPKFARAELSCAWELDSLQAHFHPSVVVFATCLRNGEPIRYQGDPLQDLSMIRYPQTTQRGKDKPHTTHRILEHNTPNTPSETCADGVDVCRAGFWTALCLKTPKSKRRPVAL